MKTVQSPSRRVFLGYLAALGAAASYGTVAVIARKVISDDVPPLVVTSFSLVFGTAIMAALFHRHAMQDTSHVPRRAWLFVALAGCASAWGVSFLFFGLSQAPVVLVAPASGTAPLVSIILTHLFLQRVEKVTWRTVAGAVMVVGGVVLVTIGNS